MDDLLERPTASSKSENEEDRGEEDEFSSGDEENMDWSKLPAISRPIIPKRGEKDFEPSIQGGSGLQRHILDRKRRAMLDALGVERNTSSKSISYGVWHPSIARTHVTVARGIHFTTMGHAVARSGEGDVGRAQKVPKRLELLPEEALYLVERGAMFSWKESDGFTPSNPPGLAGMEGVPMTVQQAFSEMIGTEDLSLEKYQVYAYLKRLGYVVTRARPPTTSYPSAAPFKRRAAEHSSIWRRVWNLLTSSLKSFLGLMSWRFDWWKPLRHHRWFYHNMDYPSVYRSLQFLPSGHTAPLRVQQSPPHRSSPYEIFYNLYKPETSFRKTSPPPPDFSVVVVNARTTPMPTLLELSALFGALPELPPPEPRKRVSYAEQRAAKSTPSVNPPPTTGSVGSHSRTFFGHLLSFIYPFSNKDPPTPHPVRKPNPFAVLKAGKKLVVVAAVDAGTISFFGFRQGAFEELPMI